MLISSPTSQLTLVVNPSIFSNTKHQPTDSKDQNPQDLDSTAESDTKNKSTQASTAEQRRLQQLKNRDREVKAHELAHVSVGGRYVTSGARFSYEKGPNGQLYAVAGEVGINTSEVPGDPRATLLKAQVIARAALAPANPSAQDRNVAAQATAMMQQAKVDIAVLLADSTEKEVGLVLDTFA